MLVGRAAEMAVVEEQLDAAFGGRGRVIVVEGEPGIGKSSLLAATIDSARWRGADTFVAPCYELGQARPFGPIVDATSTAGWRPPALDQSRAGDAGVLRSAPFEAAPELRTVVVEQVVAFLEARCLRSPVLLCLDDLQWADSATLVAVASLCRRVRDQPMLIALALRPASHPTEFAALLDTLSGTDRPLAALVDVTRLDLTPLGEDDANALAAEAAGGPLGVELRKSILRCDGNPLLVLEMVTSLREARMLDRVAGTVELSAGATNRLPGSFTESVRAKVARFEGETRALAVLASLLGVRFDLADLAAVTGRSVTDLLPFAHQLVDARVFRDDGNGLAFRHDLVREAVADALPPSLRAELHRTIAGQLRAAGAPARRVAQHVALGALPGSREAVRTLQDAAAEIAPQDPSGAATLLRRAVELCALTDELRDRVSADLLDALAWSGRTREASAVADEMLHRPLVPDVEERVRSALGRSLLLLGRPLEAVPHEERLIELRAVMERSVAWAQAECAACRMFAFDLDGALTGGATAVELGFRDDDPLASILGLCVQSFALNCLGDSAAAVDSASRAVMLADSTPQSIGHRLAPHLFRAVALISSGDKPRGLSSCRFGRLVGDALGAVWAGPIYHYVTALAHWDVGEWDDLLAEVDAGIHFGDEYGSTIGQVWALAVAGRVHLYRDDLEAARDLLDRADALIAAGGLQVGVDWQVLSRALLLEAEGRPTEALELLCLGWDGAAGLGAQSSLVHFGAELARLAVAADDVALGRRVTGALRVASHRSPADALLQGRLLRAEGLVEHNATLLARAAGTFDAISLPVEAAASRAEAGRLLADAGHPHAAVPSLEAALREFDRVHAHRVADELRAQLARLRPVSASARAHRRPASGWDALTPTESEVVDEVCSGRSNGEVAERLGVSRRTVEAHLRSIYAKLGVATRLALAVARQSRS